ncbi:MAG: N-acetylmuramoyl-L-alanine amidase [Paracoccus denitrificans]|nr:MAG: N-acetylmuramoyl-L-alanine amidase [Paracoccus denitrificans]PZO85943.1 MAG: N-acetylmuramoyl-L-alanine amidase [Paracoccus denitrificans]
MPFPSPNHGPRRGILRPELIVLHYTGMTDAASARDRLCDPTAEVSAHWLLLEDGTAEPLVAEDRRAWHAGAGSWQGRDDVNSRSIGIEIVNPGDRPFPARQMSGLQDLLGGIMARHGIGRAGVIGHSDMAPDRKFDPGARFDWRRLALENLAICPAPTHNDNAPTLDDSLSRIGYPMDGGPSARLSAFRLRFRPWGTGPEDAADRAIAAKAAQEFEAARLNDSV